MAFGSSNKVGLVTGSGDRIGKPIAGRFASFDAKVVLVGTNDEWQEQSC